jgi:endonuclease G
MPAADQIMFNRHYVLGYSYYFRQAKWALEIIDPDITGLVRSENFRPDYRIPEMFRADLVDYAGSGYDRGHLVASANQIETALQNSETFLLSNMSPQRPQFNRISWKELEGAVRNLDAKSEILETYVICGPIFYFDQPVETIGARDPNEVTIPVPHAYFKSVLTENNRGALHMWSFVLPNEASDQSLDTFLVPTTLVEKLAGIKLWERLVGRKIDKEKSKIRRMW